MGHCEMLLAVAGLDKEEVAEHTQRLASGDWSTFSPAERAAFAFARKQAKDPASITDADFQHLVRHYGPERAVDMAIAGHVMVSGSAAAVTASFIAS